MAIYGLDVQVFSRGKGSCVTAAAAYRAGERIRDDRSCHVYDSTDRADVVHAQILLPTQYENNADYDWARNRSVLWNEVQGSGQMWNSRLAREVLVLLPDEFTPAQRLALTRSFSQELADRYNAVADFAIHKPRASAPQRHHHAHILFTCRQPSPHGMGARTTLELSGTERRERGLGPSKGELLWTRERWAQVGNQALKNAGMKADLDHRSYAARGIDREPCPLLPRKVFYAEQKLGAGTRAGNNIRARYQERVEARLKGPEELQRVLSRQRETARQRVIQEKENRSSERKIPAGAMTHEQHKAKWREYWKAHAPEIHCRRRAWAKANAEKVNRRQREYQKKWIAKKRAKERGLRVDPKSLAKGRAQSQDLAQRRSPPISAPSRPRELDPLVQRIVTYRASRKGLEGPDPVEKLLAYRKAQIEKGLWISPERSRELAEAEREPKADNGASPNEKRGPKNDLGL